MFWSKNNKKVYPCKTLFFYINVRYKGVYISRTCYPDVSILYLVWVLASDEMCLSPVKVKDIKHRTVKGFKFLMSLNDKRTHNARMKHASGQNKRSQNSSLSMCFCSFATGKFYTLKTQSVRHAIELQF